MNQQTIYVISGPLGVGKTTVTKNLVDNLKNGVLIEGDTFFNATEKINKLSWEKRIELAWNSILSTAKIYVETELDVVIDFVVENELNWLIKNTKELNVQIKYVVLIADEKTLELRLEKREEVQYLNRSLVLLKQLTNDPSNHRYIIDTTEEDISKIVEEILSNNEYFVVQ